MLKFLQAPDNFEDAIDYDEVESADEPLPGYEVPACKPEFRNETR
jgi:hypothetical protein